MKAESSYLRFDREFSDWARSYCSDESQCLPVTKFLTESPYMTLLFAVSVAFLVWRSSRPLGQLKQRLLLLLMGASVGIGDFFANQLKYVFSRARPDFTLQWLEQGIKPSFSFPSNHAFNLFALAGILWLLYQKKIIQGVKFPILVSMTAVLVAISRVFVGRHYPLDVLGGLAFACIYAFLAGSLIARIVSGPRR